MPELLCVARVWGLASGPPGLALLATLLLLDAAFLATLLPGSRRDVTQGDDVTASDHAQHEKQLAEVERRAVGGD